MKYKTYIFTPLSSEKYKIWNYFFLIFNVFIVQDENFYGIHWVRVNFLFNLLFTGLVSYLTSPNKTWTSWRRRRLPLANARFASLLSKVMYIIKRKFKCLSWIWLLFHLVKWEKMYISFVPSALMKYTFFHVTRWNKSHIHSKHLNILYLFFIYFFTLFYVFIFFFFYSF